MADPYTLIDDQTGLPIPAHEVEKEIQRLRDDLKWIRWVADERWLMLQQKNLEIRESRRRIKGR